MNLPVKLQTYFACKRTRIATCNVLELQLATVLQTQCPTSRARSNAPNAEFNSSRNCRICFVVQLQNVPAHSPKYPPNIPVRLPGRCLRACTTSLRADVPACHDVCRPCAGATGLLDEYIATCYILPYFDLPLSACVLYCGSAFLLRNGAGAIDPDWQTIACHCMPHRRCN